MIKTRRYSSRQKIYRKSNKQIVKDDLKDVCQVEQMMATNEQRGEIVPKRASLKRKQRQKEYKNIWNKFSALLVR